MEEIEQTDVLSYNDQQKFIYRLYEKCLDREPSAADIEYWVKSIENGQQTGTTLANIFINSDELKRKSICDYKSRTTFTNRKKY